MKCAALAESQVGKEDTTDHRRWRVKMALLTTYDVSIFVFPSLIPGKLFSTSLSLLASFP